MITSIIRRDGSSHCSSDAIRPVEVAPKSKSTWEREIYLSSHDLNLRKTSLAALDVSQFLLFLGFTLLSYLRHIIFKTKGRTPQEERGGGASSSSPPPYRETFLHTHHPLLVSLASLTTFQKPDIYCIFVGGAS